MHEDRSYFVSCTIINVLIQSRNTLDCIHITFKSRGTIRKQFFYWSDFSRCACYLGHGNNKLGPVNKTILF